MSLKEMNETFNERYISVQSCHSFCGEDGGFRDEDEGFRGEDKGFLVKTKDFYFFCLHQKSFIFAKVSEHVQTY